MNCINFLLKIINIIDKMKGKNYYSARKDEAITLDNKNRTLFDLDYFNLFLNNNKKVSQNGLFSENFATERNSSAKNKEINNISDTGNHGTLNVSVPDRVLNSSIKAKKGDNKSKMNEKTKKNENFINVYKRLMAYDDARKNMLQEKRKVKEIEEEKQYRKVPKISEKSKILIKNTEENVFERCLKFKKEVQKKKNELIKGKIEKIKEQEDKIINNIKLHKLDSNKIDEKINSLMDWSKKKTIKISILREDYQKKKDSENTFKPKVNKPKSSHTPDPIQFQYSNSNNVEFSERLYTLDLEKRKIKHEQLEDIYKPSFQPKTNRTKQRIRIEKVKNKRDLTPNFNKKNDKTNENNKEFSEIYNETLRDHSIHSILKEKIILNRNKVMN
jgi:hypothetical protein